MGPEQVDWIGRAEVELDNIRMAITLALAGGVDEAIAVKFSVALQGFWTMRGYTTEARNVVRSALALPAVKASAVVQAHALYVGASLAVDHSDHDEAKQMLETCLELRRGLGNPFDIASTLSTLSLARLQGGDSSGAAIEEHEALQLFCQLGDRVGEAISLIHLGQIAVAAGSDEQARGHLERGLAIAREIKHQEAEGVCELVLGETAFEAGDQPRAYVRFRRSLAVCRDAGDKRGEAVALGWLGRLDLHAGTLTQARSRLNEALRAFRAFGMAEELLGCLEDHAVCCRVTGSVELAVRLAAAAHMLRERLHIGRAQRPDSRWQLQLDTLKQALPADVFDAEWIEGCGWDVERAVASALSAPEGQNDQVALSPAAAGGEP